MKIAVTVPAGKRLIVSETAAEVKAVLETKEVNPSNSEAVEIVVKVPGGKQFVVDNIKPLENEEAVEKAKSSDKIEKENTEPVAATPPAPVKPIEDPEEIVFFYRNWQNKAVTVRGKRSDTCLSLHEKIEQIEGIPVRYQRLIYSGRQLKHEDTLADYNIHSFTTLHLAGRLLSCKDCSKCHH